MNKLQKSLKNYLEYSSTSKEKFHSFLSEAENLEYSSTSREELHGFLSEARKTGRVAIFGGMIRDFLTNDARKFNSDVDLVIECKSGANLSALSKKYNGVTNKYGGARIYLNKWCIDIWPIEETWAFKNGLNFQPTLENLYLTPFFSLDAICYLVEESIVLCSENYFDLFNNRILDVNCIHTPSDLYILKKAYRYKMNFDFDFSLELQQRLIFAFNREYLTNTNIPVELCKFYQNLQLHTTSSPLINFDYQKQLNLMRF